MYKHIHREKERAKHNWEVQLSQSKHFVKQMQAYLGVFFFVCYFIQGQMMYVLMGNKVTGLKEQYDNYSKLDYSYYKPGSISLYCRKVITRNGFSCVLINAVHKVSHPQLSLYDLCSVYAYLTLPGTSESVAFRWPWDMVGEWQEPEKCQKKTQNYQTFEGKLSTLKKYLKENI